MGGAYDGGVLLPLIPAEEEAKGKNLKNAISVNPSQALVIMFAAASPRCWIIITPHIKPASSLMVHMLGAVDGGKDGEGGDDDSKSCPLPSKPRLRAAKMKK